jgi:hypothetical protein
MVTDVREWLKRRPVPTTVRCTCADNQTRTVRVDQADKQRFVRAEEAIEAMGAIALEALDHKGNSIRLCELKAKEEPAGPLVPRSETPAQSDLAHFAVLLSKAYEQGAQSAAKPTQIAFDTMGQLMTLVLKRLENVEAQQIRQLNAAAKAAAAIESAGAGEGMTIEDLLAQFMGGLAMARGLPGAEPHNAETANGAAKAAPDA